MRVFLVDEAREKGFEPNTYSQYPPTGEMLARIDFMAWRVTTQILYFRQEGSGVRYFIPLHSTPKTEGMTPYAMNALFPYLQQGDLCRLVILQTDSGGYLLNSAEIIQQMPICTRREQCQPSPCCVFKN